MLAGQFQIDPCQWACCGDTFADARVSPQRRLGGSSHRGPCEVLRGFNCVRVPATYLVAQQVSGGLETAGDLPTGRGAVLLIKRRIKGRKRLACLSQRRFRGGFCDMAVVQGAVADARRFGVLRRPGFANCVPYRLRRHGHSAPIPIAASRRCAFRSILNSVAAKSSILNELRNVLKDRCARLGCLPSRRYAGPGSAAQLAGLEH